MQIKRFDDHQAKEVAALVKHNLLEISSQYYSAEYIARIIDHLSASKLIARADTEHIFVATEKGEIVGTGTLSNFGSEENPKCYGTAVFVKLGLHKKGIGTSIMQKLEEKAAELGANKITVRAAVNARIFYEKLGYHYQNEIALEDERGNYIMEKEL